MPQPQPDNPQRSEPPEPVPQPPQPPRQEERPRFRWGLFVGLPLVVLALAWVATSVRPGFAWPDVMDALGVQDRPRYTRLALLGLAVTACCAIVRILRGPNGPRNPGERS